MKRQTWTRTLFAIIAVFAIFADVASVVHLTEAFSWAFDPAMAVILAIVIVTTSVGFIALAVITPAGPERNAVLVGLALVGFIEWAGNYAVGLELVRQRLPAQVPNLFFGLDPLLAVRIAAFLFSGAIPLLVMLQVYAITKVADVLLEEPEPSPLAVHVLRRHAQGESQDHSDPLPHIEKEVKIDR